MRRSPTELPEMKNKIKDSVGTLTCHTSSPVTLTHLATLREATGMPRADGKLYPREKVKGVRVFTLEERPQRTVRNFWMASDTAD